MEHIEKTDKMKKNKKTAIIISTVSGCIALILAIFLILWFTVIPIPTVKQEGLVYRLSTCHFKSDIESKCYNIERYEGNESIITLQPVRGLPLIIQDKVNGAESVQTIIIENKFNNEEELSYLINDCLDGFVNLQTLLVEGRLSFIDSDRVFMNGVEVIFGYKN